MNERKPLRNLFEIGDRVRIVTIDSAYTGCRGFVAAPPSEVPADEEGRSLGYYVAIDGENGRVRPFLTQELERLRAVRVPGRAAVPGSRAAPRAGNDSQ